MEHWSTDPIGQLSRLSDNYYAMVRFCKIDLKLCPTAQFEENCITGKKNAKFK